MHNGQKAETTPVSTDGWMDEHNVVCLYSGILANYKGMKDGYMIWHDWSLET